MDVPRLRLVAHWQSKIGRDVTLSAYAPINYRVPANFANKSQLNPAASDYNSYLYYNDRRVCAYGSQHPGGANFAEFAG